MNGAEQITVLAQAIQPTGASGSLAGGVVAFAAAVAMLAGCIRALCIGIAKIRIAEAWKIWAGRCDPMNPNFQPPPIESKPPKP